MINLETEVSSGFDHIHQICTYTIDRDGKRWTAKIPFDTLRTLTNKMAKRTFIANALNNAMLGPPDPNPTRR